MSNSSSKIQSVEDARYLAQRRLPNFLYQAYEAGSGTGATLRANVEAFKEVSFRPRVGVFFPRRKIGARVLGHEISMPVLLAPVGTLRLGHRDGEIGVARAAGAAGTIQIVSTLTGSPLEEITAAATGPIFYQLYFLGGRASAEAMIDRAKRCGCRALVVTVDAQFRGSRERPFRQRAYTPASASVRDLFRALPQLLSRPAWLLDFILDRNGMQLPMGLRSNGKPASVFERDNLLYEKTPTWEDVAWIRKQWGDRLVVKGILTVEDARHALAAGADAIVVSNHGGNLFDGTPATLRVLPEIVADIGDEIEIWMDSGIRRGSDVVKAVALGAKAVLIGRAYVYALMAAGELGVRRILEVFRGEIDETLASLGCPDIDSLNHTYVQLPTAWPQPAKA